MARSRNNDAQADFRQATANVDSIEKVLAYHTDRIRIYNDVPPKEELLQILRSLDVYRDELSDFLRMYGERFIYPTKQVDEVSEELILTPNPESER